MRNASQPIPSRRASIAQSRNEKTKSLGPSVQVCRRRSRPPLYHLPFSLPKRGAKQAVGAAGRRPVRPLQSPASPANERARTHEHSRAAVAALRAGRVQIWNLLPARGRLSSSPKKAASTSDGTRKADRRPCRGGEVRLVSFPSRRTRERGGRARASTCCSTGERPVSCCTRSEPFASSDLRAGLVSCTFWTYRRPKTDQAYGICLYSALSAPSLWHFGYLPAPTIENRSSG